MFKAAVLTVSDRSFRGERPDAGGPLVVEILKNAGYAVTETAIVPDEKGRIEAALRQWCDREPVDLIVTTGGTGFAPRDVTPEATLAVCDRLTPGIPEAMRYASMQVTNRAIPGRGGHPEGDAHRESPRLSQGGQGKPGGRPPRARPRAGDALRTARRLRRADGLTCFSNKRRPLYEAGVLPFSLWRVGTLSPVSPIPPAPDPPG